MFLVNWAHVCKFLVSQFHTSASLGMWSWFSHKFIFQLRGGQSSGRHGNRSHEAWKESHCQSAGNSAHFAPLEAGSQEEIVGHWLSLPPPQRAAEFKFAFVVGFCDGSKPSWPSTCMPDVWLSELEPDSSIQHWKELIQLIHLIPSLTQMTQFVWELCFATWISHNLN